MTQWSEDQIGALPFIGILVQEEDGEGKRDPESWKRGFTRGKRMRRRWKRMISNVQRVREKNKHLIEAKLRDRINLFISESQTWRSAKSQRTPILHQQLFTTAVATIPLSRKVSPFHLTLSHLLQNPTLTLVVTLLVTY